MTLALRPGDFPSAFPPLYDRAQSQEGQMLTRAWASLIDDRSATAGVGQALAELDTAAGDAVHANWDGYGAAAVLPAAYFQARRLLQLLPSAVPAPDIAISPKGHVALEWHGGPQWAFSAVLDADRNLTYAGLFGSGRAHGKEVFTDEIPGPFVATLYRYLTGAGPR
ncbi:MAG: hypothetical protein ABI742_02465 [Gemmatimonadota bacterium]